MDEKECRAAGLSSVEAIELSVSGSRECWQIEVDGAVVAYWGYGSVSPLSGRAFGWLLTCPAIEQYKIAFVRASKKIVETILEDYQERAR